MRSARCRAGIRRRVTYATVLLVRSASEVSHTSERQKTTQPRSRERTFKTVHKKTPLLQPANDPVSEQLTLENTGSRKHAVFSPLRIACLLQQRAGYRVTSPIQNRSSNSTANCQEP